MAAKMDQSYVDVYTRCQTAPSQRLLNPAIGLKMSLYLPTLQNNSYSIQQAKLPQDHTQPGFHFASDPSWKTIVANTFMGWSIGSLLSTKTPHAGDAWLPIERQPSYA